MMAGANNEDNREEGSQDLSSLTVAQLKALAADNGYTLTSTKKADIIAEIEEQQEG